MRVPNNKLQLHKNNNSGRSKPNSKIISAKPSMSLGSGPEERRIPPEKVKDGNFEGADLSGRDLRGINFGTANLSDANLSGANLSGADLRNADLRGADLSGAILLSVGLFGRENRAQLPNDLKGVKLTGIHNLAEILSPTKENKGWLSYFTNSGLPDITNGCYDFRGADLSGADLCEADLSKCNLSRTNLEGANLTGAILPHDLTGSNLSETNLSGQNLVEHTLRYTNLRAANLIGAELPIDLQETNLSKTDLRGVLKPNVNYYLSRADLSNTVLSGLNLSGSDLTGTRLEKADLRRCTLPTGDKAQLVNIKGADMRGAKIDPSFLDAQSLHGVNQTQLAGAEFTGSLRGVNLVGADFREANLREVDFTQANLFGANFERANLTKAVFTEASLGEAKLIGADLTGADLRNSTLRKANLSNSNLRGANLKGGIFHKAILEGADLTNAQLNGGSFYLANLVSANLTGSNLSGADLTKTDLSGANLSGANLADANLEDANLQRTSFEGVNLEGVDLTEASLNSDQRQQLGLIFPKGLENPDVRRFVKKSKRLLSELGATVNPQPELSSLPEFNISEEVIDSLPIESLRILRETLDSLSDPDIYKDTVGDNEYSATIQEHSSIAYSLFRDVGNRIRELESAEVGQFQIEQTQALSVVNPDSLQGEEISQGDEQPEQQRDNEDQSDDGLSVRIPNPQGNDGGGSSAVQEPETSANEEAVEQQADLGSMVDVEGNSSNSERSPSQTTEMLQALADNCTVPTTTSPNTEVIPPISERTEPTVSSNGEKVVAISTTGEVIQQLTPAELRTVPEEKVTVPVSQTN